MKMKKQKSLALAMLITAMTTVMIAPVVPVYGASDISDHWAEGIIKEASSLGIVSGYDDGSYQPEAYIKREEFYTLLTKIMTVKPDTSSTVVKFPDVKKGEWYEPVIKTSVAAGIASGYEDGTFGIGRLMSRQEAAKVVASVIQTKNIPEGTAGADGVKDKGDIGPWAKPYVDTMFQKSYMKGDDQNMLNPANALKRCEAITILLNVKKNEKIVAANADQLAKEQQIVAEGIGCKILHSTGTGIFVAGEGTKRLPYEVKTEDQLDHIKEHSNQTEFFLLKNDITITKDFAKTKPSAGSGESDWSIGNFVPVGSLAAPFKGNIDGGNYIIKGLDIKGISGAKSSGEDKPNASYAGLIGVLDKGGNVSNLTIEGTILGNQYVGGLVGYNGGTIENCTLGANGKVTGVGYTGGITGYSTAPINKNYNRGSVESSGQYTGGIVGYVSSSGQLLYDCINYGTVKGADKLGGIAGSVYGAGNQKASVVNCSNEGTINAGQYNAGGVLGSADVGSGIITIENCGNKGTLVGDGYNGGVIGILTSKNVTVDSCYNSGSVEGSGAGGILGNNEGFITNSYNSGTVSGTQEAGGIVALQQDTGRITKSYNEGTVKAEFYAGGIAGENDAYLDNCYNSGTINADQYAGGIAGRNKSTIANSYNAGKITGTLTSGTLAGRNGGTILTSYWLDSTGVACVGMADRANAYDPLTVRQLNSRELSGQDKFVQKNKYVLLVNLMNSNNLTQSDIINNIKPNEVWKYNYRYTSANGGASQGGSNELPQFDLIDDKNKPGNIIDSSDLSNGTYLYPQIAN